AAAAEGVLVSHLPTASVVPEEVCQFVQLAHHACRLPGRVVGRAEESSQAATTIAWSKQRASRSRSLYVRCTDSRAWVYRYQIEDAPLIRVARARSPSAFHRSAPLRGTV